MTDIRSYRRVFDLERRIYSVDRVRLNPGGVPVRGVVYLLGLVATMLAASRAPVLGTALALVPWYLRELAVPAALATVLAAIRVDGRTFHLAAWAVARSLARPTRSTRLLWRSRAGSRWWPPEIVFLPDGSEPELRALRYTGPGAVRVSVPHRRRSRRRGRLFSRRPVVEIRSIAGSARRNGMGPGDRGRVLSLEAGVELLVVSDGRR